MDPFHQRGRSPSAGHSPHSHSPSPHPGYQNPATSLGLDPSIDQSTFTTGKFNTAGFDGMNQNALNYNFQQQHVDQAQYIPQTSLPDNFYNPGQMQNQFQQDPITPSSFNAGTTLDSFIDPTGGQGDFVSINEYTNQNYNPEFNPDFTQQASYQNQQAFNADLSHMSSPHIPTPPANLLSPEDHTSPGQSPSPSSASGQYYTPHHSRHASLDPLTAAYPQQGQEWQGMLDAAAFQNHRRMASDQSDISSSAAPSPYLGHQDGSEVFDESRSPLLNPLPDSNDYINDFGMQNINLTEQSRRSPYHSAHASPQIIPQPQQGLGLTPEFSLTTQIGQTTGPGPEIFTSHVDNALQKLHEANGSSTSDMGQASQFPVPTIDIEPAPVSRQASFEPDKGDSRFDTLSPPTRASGTRGRSKSDPHVRPGSRQDTRNASPGAGHVRSPSLAGHSTLDSHSARSLSPMAPLTATSSRDPSPNRVEKNRRSSTSSVPSRDYILDLADPDRPNASPNAGNARVQKHPATFQCTLCPKRFTRAYNLRSHLRTHTDERPFVCTVCGKAFARQHDRKRHEGLHSGEKKFICKGGLASGGQWGCGRRFARADALGRHFRSEAGRICIKPLLDEEAAEKRQQRVAEQGSVLDVHGGLQPVQQPIMIPSNGPSAEFMLPAALLAQYPALNNIDWSTVQPGDDPGDLSDFGGATSGGRSSFDASGSELWGEEDDLGASEGFVNPAVNGGMYPQAGGWS